MSRKRSLIVVVALAGTFLVNAVAVAQFPREKKDKTVGRLLLGKVLDRQDNPLPDSVVYVTNTRNRAVKTYIVGQDGSYRFPALSAAIDYEVYAQYKGAKSDTKSLSQFDERTQVYVVLKIDAK